MRTRPAARPFADPFDLRRTFTTAELERSPIARSLCDEFAKAQSDIVAELSPFCYAHTGPLTFKPNIQCDAGGARYTITVSCPGCDHPSHLGE